jgi:hypothetical protein
MRELKRVSIPDPIMLKNREGSPVSLEGTSQYDASSLFSDTVDLPTPGRIYIGASGTLELMLVGDTIALPWTVDQPTLLPVVVKRIMSTGSDAITTYIVN